MLDLVLEDADGKLRAAGVPLEGPGLLHDKTMQDLLSCAHHLLEELADAEVDLQNEAESPLVAAVVDTLRGTEYESHMVSVAVCESRGCWAAGIGGPALKRQQTAKLALCAALAPGSEHFAAVAEHTPAFAELCEELGCQPEGSPARRGPPPKRQRQAPHAAQVAEEQEGAHGAWAWARGRVAEEQEEAEPEPAYEDVIDLVEEVDPLPGTAAGLPGDFRDTPIWLTLETEEGLPECLLLAMGEGTVPLEVLAVSTDGCGRRELYSQVDKLLAHLLSKVGMEGAKVDYKDDACWELFPGVGEAVRGVTGSEECLVAATCADLNLWAVGVGMKGKCRWMAAKVALAATLAIQAPELVQIELPDLELEEFPAFADFVEEARMALEEARAAGGGG